MLKKKIILIPSLILLACILTAGTAFIFHPTWIYGHIQEWRMRQTGAESHQVMIDGHRIHYYVCGPVDGSPIVLLHGLGGRSEDFVNLTPFLEKNGYRVYTPDMLGFGQSEEPTDASYSIQDQADLMADFFDAVGLKRADLGGWSMGGWVAQKIAVDHPERVTRLILMDSAGLKIPPAWNTDLFTPRTPAELTQLNAMLTPNPPALPGFVAQDVLRVSANYSWVVKRALASMLTARDVMDDELSSLRMPVLIMWGDLDRITPLSEGETIHRLIPQSHLVVAEGCGHIAPSNCSRDFGPAMIRFLRNSRPSRVQEPMMLGE